MMKKADPLTGVSVFILVIITIFKIMYFLLQNQPKCTLRYMT